MVKVFPFSMPSIEFSLPMSIYMLESYQSKEYCKAKSANNYLIDVVNKNAVNYEDIGEWCPNPLLSHCI